MGKEKSEKKFIELSDGMNYKHVCDNYALYEIRENYGICVEVISCHKCDADGHHSNFEYDRVGRTIGVRELKTHRDRMW